MLKENVQPPGNLDYLDILTRQDAHYFSDIRWALHNDQNFQTRSTKTDQNMILTSTKMKEIMENLAFEKVKGNIDPISYQKALKEIESEAKC